MFRRCTAIYSPPRICQTFAIFLHYSRQTYERELAVRKLRRNAFNRRFDTKVNRRQATSLGSSASEKYDSDEPIAKPISEVRIYTLPLFHGFARDFLLSHPSSYIFIRSYVSLFSPVKEFPFIRSARSKYKDCCRGLVSSNVVSISN